MGLQGAPSTILNYPDRFIKDDAVYTNEELLARPLFDFIHPEGRARGSQIATVNRINA